MTPAKDYNEDISIDWHHLEYHEIEKTIFASHDKIRKLIKSDFHLFSMDGE